MLSEPSVCPRQRANSVIHPDGGESGNPEELANVKEELVLMKAEFDLLVLELMRRSHVEKRHK